MAIRDLLWACPECGAVRALRAAKRGEACVVCGTVYRRGPGSSIIAEPRQGEPVVRSAAAWSARLPDAAVLADPPSEDAWDERVEARFARGERPLRKGGEYLGRAERFGRTHSGVLCVRPDAVRFQGDEGSERRWPIERITAVQASSSSLQLKIRGEPVVSFRFPSGSLRFWEERLQQVLRRAYREDGKGEILEFQPRIVAR